MELGPWNSLEVAKLAASFVMPLAVAIFGIYVHRLSKRFEHGQWKSQTLIEKRLAVYDDLAPSLNDLLCFFTFVGAWKEMDPPTAVALKRQIDRKIHLAAPLFSPGFFHACMTFQNLCFQAYTGWGLDARLRTDLERRKESWINKKWDPSWDDLFSDQLSDPETVRLAYRELMIAFAIDLGVADSLSVPQSGHVPPNIGTR